MTTILCVHRYEDGSEMNCSDQITVHSRVWEDLHREHTGGSRPLFVSVAELGAEEMGVVGRIIPSAGAATVALDTCIIPAWMWLSLGAPEEMWVCLRPTDIPDAGSVRLRPRGQILTTLENPLEALSDALSGSTGQSWACLNQGAELPLNFGTFDVLEVKSIEGFPVPSACILNLDVDLELESALASIQRPPTPIPAKLSTTILTPVCEFEPPPGVMWFAGMEKIVGCKR